MSDLQIFAPPLPEDPTRSSVTALRLVLKLTEHKALYHGGDKEWERLFLKELEEYTFSLGGRVVLNTDFDDFTPEPGHVYFIWGTLGLYFSVKHPPILVFPTNKVAQEERTLNVHDSRVNRLYMKTRLTVFSLLEDGSFEVSFPDTF